MRAIDLFCGAGGSSMGLKQAGFSEIVGVDLNEQPEYPFKFIKANVFDLSLEFLKQFDFIWASPPCQAYSWSARRWHKDYPDLVDRTRNFLSKTGKPFVIENVCSAPIRKDLILCGEMFNLRVIRHRAFEIHGLSIPQPKHKKHRGTVKNGYYVTVAGHGGDGKASLKSWQKAMDIDWITDKKMLAQAVPPAYAEYIGKYCLKEIK